MQFIRKIIDFFWASANATFSLTDIIPGWFGPVKGWIIDRINDLISILTTPLDWLRTIEWWIALVHDAIFYILDWDNIKALMAQVFEIPEWTWTNVILKIVDAFIYVIAFAEDKRGLLANALKSTFEGFWELLIWTSDQWRFLIVAVIESQWQATNWLYDAFKSYVWGRLTAVGGDLEEWLESRKDYILDELLDIGQWVWDWLSDIPSIPKAFMDKVFWGFLGLLNEISTEFIEWLLNAAKGIVPIIAEPISDIGTKILDYIWDD